MADFLRAAFGKKASIKYEKTKKSTQHSLIKSESEYIGLWKMHVRLSQCECTLCYETVRRRLQTRFLHLIMKTMIRHSRLSFISFPHTCCTKWIQLFFFQLTVFPIFICRSLFGHVRKLKIHVQQLAGRSAVSDRLVNAQ